MQRFSFYCLPAALLFDPKFRSATSFLFKSDIQQSREKLLQCRHQNAFYFIFRSRRKVRNNFFTCHSDIVFILIQGRAAYSSRIETIQRTQPPEDKRITAAKLILPEEYASLVNHDFRSFSVQCRRVSHFLTLPCTKVDIKLVTRSKVLLPAPFSSTRQVTFSSNFNVKFRRALKPSTVTDCNFFFFCFRFRSEPAFLQNFPYDLMQRE